MKVHHYCAAMTFVALAACDDIGAGIDSRNAGFIDPLPEQVVAIAAPYQNLKAVRIDPADGCYVYQHAGPVETTFLPLRTNEGRPICSVVEQPAEAAAG